LSHLLDPDAAIKEAARVVCIGGTVAVFDGDYCSTTLSSGPDDPLQRCADTYIGSIVHDPWFMRGCARRLLNAGLEPGPLALHGFTDPDYFLGTAERGADAMLAAEEIDAASAQALKADATLRHTNGELYGHMLYATIVAINPET
jgi:arsenite methyltransferase